MKLLWDKIFSLCEPDLLTHSRVHPIPSFNHADCQVFVKREDESGFGISGCKKRKYASLIPFLKKERFELTALIGGLNSNHIVGISQLLRENRIPFLLFLREFHESPDQILAGNNLLTRLLTEPEQITWIKHSDWPEVEKIAGEQMVSQNAFVIPEGGSCRESLPGALTLMHDIIRNEEEIGEPFDHIFIDSGTALIAGSLAMMNHLLERKTQIHIVLMADDETYFSRRLSLFQQWLEEDFSISIPPDNHLKTYLPVTARSFGSVNATVIKETRRFAIEEGLITDPVYTTKLFMTAREMIHQNHLKGKILIIHSGGGTGLMGFAGKLKQVW